MQWGRALWGSIALFIVLTSGSFVIALATSMAALQLAPDRAGYEIAITVRKAIYFLFATVVYGGFALSFRRWRLLHTALACGLVQVSDILIVTVMLGRSLDYFVWEYWVLGLLPAVAGCALTLIWPGHAGRVARLDH